MEESLHEEGMLVGTRMGNGITGSWLGRKGQVL